MKNKNGLNHRREGRTSLEGDFTESLKGGTELPKPIPKDRKREKKKKKTNRLHASKARPCASTRKGGGGGELKKKKFSSKSGGKMGGIFANSSRERQDINIEFLGSRTGLTSPKNPTSKKENAPTTAKKQKVNNKKKKNKYVRCNGSCHGCKEDKNVCTSRGRRREFLLHVREGIKGTLIY